MQDSLRKRIDRVAAGILENEALTVSLDDDAAALFLKWALSRAEATTRTTEGLAEEETDILLAETISGLRLFAKMLGRWQETADKDSLFADLMGQAAMIYGENFNMPATQVMQRFVQQYGAVPSPIFLQALFTQLSILHHGGDNEAVNDNSSEENHESY